MHVKSTVFLLNSLIHQAQYRRNIKRYKLHHLFLIIKKPNHRSLITLFSMHSFFFSQKTKQKNKQKKQHILLVIILTNFENSSMEFCHLSLPLPYIDDLLFLSFKWQFDIYKCLMLFFLSLRSQCENSR